MKEAGCLISRFSCVWLFSTLWALSSPPGSSVHGILQVKILEWLSIPSSRVFSQPKMESISPVTSALQVDSLPLNIREAPRSRLGDGRKQRQDFRLSLASVWTSKELWSVNGTTEHLFYVRAGLLPSHTVIVYGMPQGDCKFPIGEKFQMPKGSPPRKMQAWAHGGWGWAELVKGSR